MLDWIRSIDTRIRKQKTHLDALPETLQLQVAGRAVAVKRAAQCVLLLLALVSFQRLERRRVCLERLHVPAGPEASVAFVLEFDSRTTRGLHSSLAAACGCVVAGGWAGVCVYVWGGASSPSVTALDFSEGHGPKMRAGKKESRIERMNSFSSSHCQNLLYIVGCVFWAANESHMLCFVSIERAAAPLDSIAPIRSMPVLKIPPPLLPPSSTHMYIQFCSHSATSCSASARPAKRRG